MRHIIRSTTGALVAGMIAAGCSTAPPASDVAAANTALSNAGQAIDLAAANPHVAKYTASELERAQGSLQQANAAWKNKHDLAATTHFAYLARQRASTAQALANERAAHEAVTVAAANRDHAVSLAAAQTPASPATEQVPQGLAGFPSGTAKLPDNAVPVIAELAVALKNNPESKIVIEGHTDNVGSPRHNQALALERAQAVRTALVRQGVEASRITVRSLGEQNPVASNDTSAGRRENRRADVIIAETETRMVGSSQGSTSATSSGAGEQSGQGQQSGQNGQNAQSGQTGQSEQGGQNGQSEQRRE
jgi:outer membrane protein OmpA-like peptidoglycan-associated protein